MDKTTTEIIDKLKEILKNLENKNISIDRAYLFGSYAKGNYTEFSDIDLAIISDDFQGIRFLDRKKIENEILSSNYFIEPMTFRPEDFNNDNPIALEIVNTGILLV